MLKKFSKLTRSLLILAILLGGLFVSLGMNSNFALAKANGCCEDCELDKAICMSYCQIHPGTPLCHQCTIDYRQCFLACDEDC
jgi:hypothetical protein